MWCQVILALAVALSAIQANNSFFENFGVFQVEPDHALEGHVIKTLPQFKADCMATCKETLSCFSINTYKDQHGNNMCDLNRSTKRQSPKSFARRVGYNYYEPSKGEFCVKDDCPTKEALPGNWYKFNSSSYKYFINATNWDAARKICQTLGGDLASFPSKTENEFVFETLLHDLNITTESDIDLSAHLKFDGTDAGVRLIGGASFETKESKPAISLNGTNFAEIPRFDLNDTDFTIAVYIFTSTRSPMVLLQGSSGSTSSFGFGVESSNDNSPQALLNSLVFEVAPNNKIYVLYKRIPYQTWNHFAVTWDHNTAKIALRSYAKGGLVKGTASSNTSPSPELFRATNPLYRVGQGFNGWISDMVVVPRILSSQEINGLITNGVSATTNVKDTLQGAWVGLNDKATEGNVQWSDGLPLTYKPNEDLGNSDMKDCGLFHKINEDESAWKTEICQENAPFICKKNH